MSPWRGGSTGQMKRKMVKACAERQAAQGHRIFVPPCNSSIACIKIITKLNGVMVGCNLLAGWCAMRCGMASSYAYILGVLRLCIGRRSSLQRNEKLNTELKYIVSRQPYNFVQQFVTNGRSTKRPMVGKKETVCGLFVLARQLANYMDNMEKKKKGKT